MEQNFEFTNLCNFIDEMQPCMDDYLYVYDYDGDIYHISKAACDFFKLPSNHFSNVSEVLKNIVYYEDYPVLMEELKNIRGKSGAFHNLEYRWISKNGNPVWINCRGKITKLSNDHTILLGSIIDIGALQKADPVSGLLSAHNLHNLFRNYKKNIFTGYILRIGIDNFKDITEKLGIDYGDLIIKKTAECIKPFVMKKQQLYKLVGDEFIIIDITGGTTANALEQYKKIRNSIDDFIEENHYEAVYTISAGVLPLEGNTEYTISSFMKLSEFAVQEAKRNGRNQSYVFSKKDYDAFVRMRDISTALRQSVNQNFEGFSLYLQPLYNAKKKKITGAESLLRFHTPEFGMISPAEFIPILEDSGLIIPVGKWVLHTALYMCQEISKISPDFKIGINVSAIQILKSNIISEILNAVSSYDIKPEQVTIELTESGNLCSDVIIKKMWRKLKDQGVNLALDDFGTGYSNFHYIDEIQPDIIKIDRTLTMKAYDNEYFYHLLSLLSNMLHKLAIRFCIEGIETEEEYHKLSKLKPDIFQGYYWGCPISYDEFLEKLRQ